MKPNKKKKKEFVLNIKKIIKKSVFMVRINFHKINVQKITELRKILFKTKCLKLKVIKNSLLNLAIKNTPFESAKNKINGQNLIILSKSELYSPIYDLKIFKENNKNLEINIKNVSFNGKILSKKKIKYLKYFKNKKKLIEKIIFLLKNNSISKLIKILNFISKTS